MDSWDGVNQMKSIKQFFDSRHAQTWQIITECSAEEQVQKQFSLFMYSLYEKIVDLCPIIKELLADDGAFGGKGPSPEEFK